MNIQNLIYFLLFLVVLSCDNQKISELEEINREQQQKISELENKSKLDSNPKVQYCYTVLEVSEDWIGEIKMYYISSDIFEISGIIVNKKYQILDNAIEQYKSSSRLVNGKIK